MKKAYLIFIILIAAFTSCDKDFEEYNTDSKKPTEVPGEYLFANAQKALGDQTASTNVNNNVWKLFAQYWTETTYTDEANYDIVNRSIPDLNFRIFYRDILKDLAAAEQIITAEEAVGDIATAEKQNKLLIIDMLEVYCYQELVDIFGNVPYTEALDIENLSPAYDDAFTIYKDLLNRVAADVAGLNDAYGSFGSNDLYMSGDVAMWKKFGNTLRLKLAINLCDVDATLAGDNIAAAYAGAFGPGELCQISYPGGANSNPIYVDLVQSLRHDFVPANTIVDIMNPLEDPRRPKYFEINGDEYRGGPYGELAPFEQYSHVADPIQAPDYPMVIADYTEVAFYLAEAAARGIFDGGGSAEYWYNEGIKSSFLSWGLSETDADDYLAKPEVAYATATGDYKQKIGTQAWLAYYVRGFVGYTSWRRLDSPVLNIPPTPETPDGTIPVRFTYPVIEQTLNKQSYEAAVAAMGGDEMNMRLFWDKQ